MIFADWFTRVFEWRGFLISTKLSYGIYLVQFAVFHYNIANTRNSNYFGMIKSVVSDLLSNSILVLKIFKISLRVIHLIRNAKEGRGCLRFFTFHI